MRLRARVSVLLLIASNLVLVGCPNEEKKDDKPSEKSEKASKDDDKKKKGDDDDDDDEKTDKKKANPKSGDDDDDDDKPAKKKKPKGDDDDDDDDDAPPKKTAAAAVLSLTCTDSVKSLGTKVKNAFTGTCPKGCTTGAVWGSGPYTTDSRICTTAIHAGAILAADGGDVDVIISAGQTSYKGSTKNGVTSGAWAEFPESFDVTGPNTGKTVEPATVENLFAGKYSSNWGTTTFTQDGTKVSGAYPGGTLSCTVIKEVSIACQWFEGGSSGRAFMTRNATSGVLSGAWGNGTSSNDGGSWTFTPFKK
ncbi:MAG: LCCL domain-containing protein [Polyangiales bacterium]